MAMKKVLVILSQWGYWGEELLGPLETLDAAGYQLTFATSKGKRSHALPPSVEPSYIDPPLGRPVTTAEVAKKVRELDASKRLDNPKNLSTWLPERPYVSASEYLPKLEAYCHTLEKVSEQVLSEFSSLLLVGGSGPIVDMCNNQRVHDLILAFVQADRPVAAVCYGVACLAFARDFRIRKSILWGKHVTGHCLEYDYKDGTGFLGTDFNMGPPPYPLEYILRDATGPDGQYHGNFGRTVSVIVDYPFITARSTSDAYSCGARMVDVMENGLRRYGW
jgi:putative intracellular protease/amidase